MRLWRALALTSLLACGSKMALDSDRVRTVMNDAILAYVFGFNGSAVATAGWFAPMFVNLQPSNVLCRAFSSMWWKKATPGRSFARNVLPSSRCSGRISGMVVVARLIVGGFPSGGFGTKPGGGGGTVGEVGQKTSNGTEMFACNAARVGSFAASPGGPTSP